MDSPSNSSNASSNASTASISSPPPLPSSPMPLSTPGNIIFVTSTTSNTGEHRYNIHAALTTATTTNNNSSSNDDDDNNNVIRNNINNDSSSHGGTGTSGTGPTSTFGFLRGNCSILQSALRGQLPQAQFTPTVSSPPLISSVFQECDMTENMIPNLTEELREHIFAKYFKRNPSIPPSIRNEDPDLALRKAFFDFVLNVPIIIDGHKVPRKSWAKAFYETDVIQSAKCLFEALFSQYEMSSCTLNGKGGTKELSAVKMLAILRASCWMKNKNQDPYSFNPADPTHNVHPSKDEQDKIEKKVFTERRSQANRKITKGNKRKSTYDLMQETNNANSNNNSRLNWDGDSDSQQSEASHMDTQDNESVKSEGSLPDSLNGRFLNGSNGRSASIKEEDEEFGAFETLYYRFPDDFLKRLIPNRSDICIDGILIPRQKWQKAFEEAQKDTVKAAWTLFQFLFSDDEIKNCTLNGKNNTTELCPVRKLAIIRAVQWMSKNSKDKSKIHYFDNDDDACNLFPTEEDKERIETKVFTEKRYQQSRQLNTKKSSS